MTTPNNQNGTTTAPRRQRGRNAPLPTYLFETTGVEVQVRRLGPFTMDEIRKTLQKEQKAPQPPRIQVRVGEADVPMWEENLQDPDYLQAVRDYHTWLSTSMANKVLDLMVNYCIVCEVDDEAVTDKRAMLGIIDPALNDEYSDREVYVRYYLLATPQDLESVQRFILGQSMPTEEAVQEHVDTFPGGVQGQAVVLPSSAEIGVPI